VDSDVGLHAALAVEGRCKSTGGRLVCNGHFDYFGSYLVWTYHVATHKTVLYRVVPYDHPAPEVIHARAVPR
jgi:hypothetical protein